jgi:Tfp pilus assembly protein PilF
VAAIAQAIAHFEAAEGIDRGFARAAAAAARAYVVLEEYLRGRRSELAASSDELLARGLAAADRAIRLDSGVGEAWLARALIVQTLFPRSLDGVREAYERAVALEPRSGVVHGDYGVFLRRLGDNDGAERELHQALTLEPQSPGAIANLGVLEIDRRRYQAARQWFDSATTVAPSYSVAYLYRAIVDLLLGHAAAARTNGEVAARLSLGDSADAVGVLAMADVAQGDTITARTRLSWLTSAVDPEQPHWTLGIYIAPLLVALGDTAQALDLLERIRPRGLQVWYVMRSPRLDALRASARFQRLLAQSRPPGAREP